MATKRQTPVAAAVANGTKAIAQDAMTLLGTMITIGATFNIPATTKKFVARDKFKVDIEKKAKVKISYLGEHFNEWFLNKIEDPFAGSSISVRTLKEDSMDGPIIDKLGGSKQAETTLTELFIAMAAQANGQSGNLLNNDRANIFYIKDIHSTLRAVGVIWTTTGWRVDAYSVVHPHWWLANSRVFCRNSLVTQST